MKPFCASRWFGIAYRLTLGFVLCLSPILFSTDTRSFSTERLPNIVLIYVDDLGYGDLGCYGEKRWRTPNIDSLARDGIRFTDFHVSQPVCSASRASLLTGCYANRIGIHGALGPNSQIGISDREMTIAQLLKTKGYATGMVGKWHLGDSREFLPLQHGFDSYLGIPYSNDMWRRSQVAKRDSYPNLPLYDGNTLIDDDVDENDQAELTGKYKKRLISFIDEHSADPFFLYFAHTFPHVPLFAGKDFQKKSGAGVYGDVLEEMDDAVGAVLQTLRKNNLEENTLVMFSSDNGPWLVYGNHAGTAGPLREGKGTVFEGGVRVPLIARWPGRIPPGTVQSQTAMTIDILPTLAKLVDAKLPEQPIDGLDISDLLIGKPDAKCPHDAFFHYYHVNQLQAVRSGPWKLILPHTANMIEGGVVGGDGKPGKYNPLKIEEPLLFNLEQDIAESRNVAKEEPEVLAKMILFAESARATLGDSLTNRKGAETREAGTRN